VCDNPPHGAARQRADVGASMSDSRLQQIIDHERSIHRSLASFGVVLALATVSLLLLALHH
jgi:hypothetical protein